MKLSNTKNGFVFFTIKKQHKRQNVKMKSAKKIQVINLFKPNADGKSQWITREAIDKTILNWGKNGNARHGIYFGDNRYKWEKKSGRFGKITALRTIGHSDNELYGATRPVRPDIKTYFKKLPCLHCGSTSGVVADHKNGLYNDPRVLNTETQINEDFQPLCKGCNTIKREWERKTRVYKKRQPPPPSILLLSGGASFTIGDETLEENDTEWYKGTYWGDIDAFCRGFAERRLSRNKGLVRHAHFCGRRVRELQKQLQQSEEKLEQQKEKVKASEKKWDCKWRHLQNRLSNIFKDF
jgi:hypothetical protein